MRVPLALATLLALAGASASHQGCEISEHEPEIEVGGPVGPRYYSNGMEWAACPFGIPECGGLVIYEETNGIRGWQRNDDAIDNTCGGEWPSDTIVF